MIPILFGKMPAHGDFVTRGLAPAAKDAWDDYLSRGLADAREAMGDDFEAAYAAAAPWRFVAGPGRFGAGWRAGALTPSVDGAGRYFPMLLGFDGLDTDAATRLGAGIAEACEEALYAGLGAGDADALLASVSALAVEPAQEHGPTGWWTTGNEQVPPRALAGDAPDELFKAMLSV